MRILILSDLHLEFQRFDPPKVDADVVVLAGDIHTGVRGTMWAAEEFADKRVIYVAGNHEFYGSDLSELAAMRMAAERRGIHFLENDSVVIDGARFLGCALWTDFELFGKLSVGDCMKEARVCMADFNGEIKGFTPQTSANLHNQSVRWLEKALAVPFDGPTVVVTHHAPARGSIHPKYADDLVCAGFVSDLERLMGPAPLWIHGHCHDSFDYGVKGTRVVCNPRGYPLAGGGDENPDFDPGLVVEI